MGNRLRFHPKVSARKYVWHVVAKLDVHRVWTELNWRETDCTIAIVKYCWEPTAGASQYRTKCVAILGIKNLCELLVGGNMWHVVFGFH